MYQKQKMGGLEVNKNSMFNLPSVIQGCKSSRYILQCPKFSYLYEGRAQNVAIVTDWSQNIAFTTYAAGKLVILSQKWNIERPNFKHNSDVIAYTYGNYLQDNRRKIKRWSMY